MTIKVLCDFQGCGKEVSQFEEGTITLSELMSFHNIMNTHDSGRVEKHFCKACSEQIRLLINGERELHAPGS